MALSAGAMTLPVASMLEARMNDTQVAAAVQTDIRLPASELNVSAQMKEAMMEEEGVRERVYRDVAGHPTVGVGHLVTPADGLQVGQRISYDRILDLFESDLNAAERVVEMLVGNLPLYQHEYDALVDLAFNVGEGGVSPAKSPRLNAAIAAGDYAGIAEELAYHHAGGATAGGLVHRSDRRISTFLDADYGNPRAG